MSFYRGTAVTDAVKQLLESVLPANGFRTDVGQNVHVAQLRGTPTDLPCIYLVPEKELGARQYGIGQREKTYKITCVVDRQQTSVAGYIADPTAEWAIVDALIADVCEALEAPGAFNSSLVENITYEGAQPGYHETGGVATGVSLTYSIRFSIAKGDPDNPPT